LKELELLLIQFVPRQDEKVEACLKAIKGVLKKGGHESAIGAVGRTKEDIRAVANPFHVLTT
jgi:hypothetical protein